MNLKEALELRRSYYAIGNASPVSDKQLQELVEFAATHVPSAFNSQSSRLVLLLGEAHTKLWNIVKDTLRPIVPPSAFPKTEEKIDNCFAAGHGTVLFFEDQEVVAGLQKQFPAYAENFPVWSEHTSAMHQLATWTLLRESGLGASLQHYNPLIDKSVRTAYDLPDTWKLVAQMPFGNPLAAPGEKEFKPISEKVRVIR